MTQDNELSQQERLRIANEKINSIKDKIWEEAEKNLEELMQKANEREKKNLNLSHESI